MEENPSFHSRTLRGRNGRKDFVAHCEVFDIPQTSLEHLDLILLGAPSVPRLFETVQRPRSYENG
jgi:hypothetical protein